MADHFSILELLECDVLSKVQINENFPNEHSYLSLMLSQPPGLRTLLIILPSESYLQIGLPSKRKGSSQS